MIIKKLFVSSFGKYSNEKFDLSSGINVLYGLNEAGKSTIHKFIEGIFFGFFKTGVKNRSLLDDHKQYQPRNKSEYYGSMEIEFKGETLLIYRDFSKTKPAVTITNQTTGEDITHTLSIHPSTKLPDIAGFLNLSYTLYKNTISIAQIEHKDDTKNLANTVVERLTNLHTTKDESISLQNINESIDKELEEIGTSRAKTKPLFLTKELVDKYKQEMDNSKQKYEEINELHIQLNDLSQTQLKQNKQLSALEHNQFLYENELKKMKYNKAFTVYEEYQTYENICSNLKDYKTIDSQSFNIVSMNEELRQELKQKINHLKHELSQHRQKQEELYPTLNSVHYQLNQSYIEADINEQKQKRINPLVLLFVSLITIGIYYFIYRKKMKKAIEHISLFQKQISDLNPSEISVGSYSDKLLSYHSDNIYKQSSTSHANQQMQQLYASFMQLAGEVKLFDDRIREKEETLHLVSNRLTNVQSIIETTLQKNKATTKEELQENIRFKQEYYTTLIKKEETGKRLNDTLGGQTLISLNETINFDVYITYDQEEYNAVKGDIKKHYSEQLELNNQINQLNSEIMHIERNHREVDLILNDYNKAKSDYKELLDQSKVLEKVKTVLTKLSDEISFEFAPVLNEEVSSVITRITKKKYSDIKVDKGLNVKVFDERSNTNEHVSFFSKGTVDQLYLSLRIGVNNVLSSAIYPFIFDDSFVHYDDERLEEVLNIFIEEAKERQIILLTCHHRELEILQEKHAKIHHVTL